MRCNSARAWVVASVGLSLCAGSAMLGVHQSPRLTLQTDPNASPPTPPRVRVAGDTLVLSPNDWEAVGKVSPKRVTVAPFYMDATEVTHGAWKACITKGRCPALAAGEGASDEHPVTNVTAAQAARYCHAQAGRLPTRDEWIHAAGSPHANRYPWGQTGLVCRKAVFGMVSGPCARGHSTPLAVASRNAGTTPTGIFDLAGNAAEWAVDDGDVVAVGGSFRSTLAGQLKVWSFEKVGGARDDVGFRCVYPVDDAASPSLND